MKKLDVEDWIVRAIKSGRHDHDTFFTGNLYRGARKVAEFAENGRGGPMDIHYLNDDAETDFMSLARLLYGEEFTEADAILIEDMVNESEFVKRIKRNRKKKTYFSTIIDNEEVIYVVDAPYNEATANVILSNNKSVVIANEEFDVYPDGVSRVYRDE